jgi:redox-sensitive bicupin YhaK (pirin superfamily)
MSELDRRAALEVMLASTAGVLGPASAVGCKPHQPEPEARKAAPLTKDDKAVQSIFTLSRGQPFRTQDPFLFCVHHNDRFPRGNGRFGPAESLAGRRLGHDFAWKDGWNMYHGREIPGFPRHPHRGFETVTVVRQGRLDHADSMGALARYGDGDVQWLTAGAGIQHAEMFPLLASDTANPLDLFQIWLNLPARSKMVKPYFSMLWAGSIPEKTFVDAAGRKTHVTVRAGALGGLVAPAPPPDSWASDAKNEVGIWTLELSPGARWSLPAASTGVLRSLYVVEGGPLRVEQDSLLGLQGAEVRADRELQLENGAAATQVLVLQGRPIGEPVVQRGPFVMNTQAEVQQAFLDYQETEFGGWPWDDAGPVHGGDPTRFARRPDGTTERPT